MKRPERRTFLRNTGLAITAAALSEPLGPASAQTSNAAPPHQSVEAPNDVTSKLARFIVSARYEDLPDTVRHEAKRTLLNWVGCAIGGSPQETVGNAIAHPSRDHARQRYSAGPNGWTRSMLHCSTA